MRGKAPAVIGLLVLFALCAAAGYLFARFVDAGAAPPTSTPDLSNQSRLIIIQVDDLTAEHPQLDVVWLLAVSFTDPPQLSFRTLYPDQKDPEVLNHFGILPDHQPDPDFLPGIQQAFNLADVSQYILFDRVALQALSAWLGTGEVPLEGVNPQAYAAFHKALIPYGCDNAVAIAGKLPPFNWMALIESVHLRMNSGTSDLVLQWNALKKNGDQPNCEITGY